MPASSNDVAQERSTALLGAAAFFLVMTAYYIIRPVRDQLGGAVGSASLPLFYGAVFVVMLLITPVFGALVSRVSRRRLLTVSYSFFVLGQLAFVPAFMAQEQIGARALGVAFFIWASVFNLFVVSLFWSFMADIFSAVAARRAFPLIALGGMAGAVFGPVLTGVLVSAIGVAPLLVVSAVALALALGMILLLSARHDLRHGPAREAEVIGGSLWAGVKQLWARPFLRYMAVLLLLGDGIGTLAYALMADYTKAHYPSIEGRTAFYNNLDLCTNVLGAILQLTATRWLMIRRGAAWALVLPSLVNAMLLLGVLVFGVGQVSVLGVSVAMLSIMLVGSRGFAYGMTKPAVDSLYTRVPRETRYKGKNFVETAVWRFGDLLVTVGVSGLGKVGAGLSVIAAIGTGISITAAWVAQRAGNSPDLAPEQVTDKRIKNFA